VRNQHQRVLTGFVALSKTGLSHATHHAQQTLDHLLQIGFALAQVGVFHLVKLARHHLQLARQRPLGVVVALQHPLFHAADELVILQQHQVYIQQRCQLRVGIGCTLRV